MLHLGLGLVHTHVHSRHQIAYLLRSIQLAHSACKLLQKERGLYFLIPMQTHL